MQKITPSQNAMAQPATEQLRQAAAQLPARYQKKFESICDRLETWIHLQNEALREVSEAAGDLRLENLCLRFDLDVTRREMGGANPSGREEETC
jgi:hypothetical protein